MNKWCYLYGKALLKTTPGLPADFYPHYAGDFADGNADVTQANGDSHVTCSAKDVLQPTGESATAATTRHRNPCAWARMRVCLRAFAPPHHHLQRLCQQHVACAQAQRRQEKQL